MEVRALIGRQHSAPARLWRRPAPAHADGRSLTPSPAARGICPPEPSGAGTWWVPAGAPPPAPPQPRPPCSCPLTVAVFFFWHGNNREQTLVTLRESDARTWILLPSLRTRSILGVFMALLNFLMERLDPLKGRRNSLLSAPFSRSLARRRSICIPSRGGEMMSLILRVGRGLSLRQARNKRYMSRR